MTIRDASQKLPQAANFNVVECKHAAQKLPPKNIRFTTRSFLCCAIFHSCIVTCLNMSEAPRNARHMKHKIHCLLFTSILKKIHFYIFVFIYKLIYNWFLLLQPIRQLHATSMAVYKNYCIRKKTDVSRSNTSLHLKTRTRNCQVSAFAGAEALECRA